MSPATGIGIIGFAASTSVGYSLEPTLAAMGAGLSNFRDTTVVTEFGEPAVAARLLDSEAPRAERLGELLRHGLDDLRALVAPYGLRKLPVLIGVASDLRPEEQDALRAVLRETPSPLADAAWFPHGRASTFSALASAMDVLARRSHRFVVVAGIDSLCAPEQISNLVDARRLLGPFTEGTIPGEAAAFALLARMDDPLVDPSLTVRLEAVAQSRAAIPFPKAEVVSGDGLAAAFRALREGGAARVHRVIASHSGEGYLGRSFSHAYLREVEVMPEPLTVELIADRVGDVGAAAGILGLAFGVYLMVKDRRDGHGRALVYSESDSGEIGAAILDGTPTAWQRPHTSPSNG